LNDFLEIAHNADGTLQTSALQQAGGVTSVNGKTPSGGAVSLAASDVGAYVKPSCGIPEGDLSPSVQSLINNPGGGVTIGGDLGGTPSSPIVANLQGTPFVGSNPGDGQVLTYNGTSNEWFPNTFSLTASDATSSNKGILQLTGDLGGTAASPTVTSTHLNSPLPVN